MNSCQLALDLSQGEQQQHTRSTMEDTGIIEYECIVDIYPGRALCDAQFTAWKCTYYRQTVRSFKYCLSRTFMNTICRVTERIMSEGGSAIVLARRSGDSEGLGEGEGA